MAVEEDELVRLIQDAVQRIDHQMPISQAMGEALVQYCVALEVANDHLREQNALLRARLQPRTYPQVVPPGLIA